MARSSSAFFPCMTNVRIWLYRSSDSKKIKNSAVESMRFVVTLDVHINPATSIIYPEKRSLSALHGSLPRTHHRSFKWCVAPAKKNQNRSHKPISFFFCY